MTPSTENMSLYRLGLFANQLQLLLAHLSPDQFKATWYFKQEYLLAGATGLRNDDADLIRRTHCKGWPSLKQKLQALGIIRIEDGIIHDDDLEKSVKKQRDGRQHGRRGADVRWGASRAAGGA